MLYNLYIYIFLIYIYITNINGVNSETSRQIQLGYEVMIYSNHKW